MAKTFDESRYSVPNIWPYRALATVAIIGCATIAYDVHEKHPSAPVVLGVFGAIEAACLIGLEMCQHRLKVLRREILEAEGEDGMDN